MVLAGVTGTFFLFGRASSEGYHDALGIPSNLIEYTVEDAIVGGAVQSLLAIVVAPAIYYLFVVYVTKPLRKKVRKRVRQWTKMKYGDLLSFSAKYLAFVILLFLPFSLIGRFIKEGKEAGEAYLNDPVKVRYLDQSAPDKRQEAILLCWNSGRYFLQPIDRKEDVSLVIFEEGGIAQLEVIQKE